MAIKTINQLVKLRRYNLSTKEKNLYMVICKSKLLSIKNKLLNLSEKQRYNNPNIVSTYINENILNSYISKLEDEYRDFVEGVLVSLESMIEKISSGDNYSVIFLNKLKADYTKYLLEITEDFEDRQVLENQCSQTFNIAYDALSNLSPESPLVLSVILNYSVFIYSILEDTTLALDISELGYTNAIIKLNGKNIEEVTHILDLLENNNKIWKKELSVNK